MTTLANLFNWVEIPSSDFERAKTFYRTLLSVKEELQQPPMGDMLYAFLPMEPGAVGGALVKHENYHPGQGQGVCVYLIVKGEMNATLSRAEAAGGTVVVPKMSLNEMGPGYMAQIIDSEGNRIGLWSEE
ncbi:VOC family protein [Ktedonosporobacter rubrisoli]|uniref:VOC family protein n=1 Tax=Ktedonosporobacter rubrisoli TaxID=2509675 RepID=A0A4P6JLY4_KTERU|nr:VOC family protein [Ktedonosporobacter rubrisoli]QBD76248.1 VOC family protein [Ktedonosporobacter rubrisoli]